MDKGDLNQKTGAFYILVSRSDLLSIQSLTHVLSFVRWLKRQKPPGRLTRRTPAKPKLRNNALRQCYFEPNLTLFGPPTVQVLCACD